MCLFKLLLCVSIEEHNLHLKDFCSWIDASWIFRLPFCLKVEEHKSHLKVFSSWIEATRKPASRVFLAPPEGLMTFLSSLYHAWQLLLAKFFDLVKLEFWPPGPPEPPGGQGSNLNSLFRALRWEGLPLSIWFCYYKRFLRTLAYYAVTHKPKSTHKYLFNGLIWLECYILSYH